MHSIHTQGYKGKICFLHHSVNFSILTWEFVNLQFWAMGRSSFFFQPPKNACFKVKLTEMYVY